MIDTIREQLNKCADKKFQEFSTKITKCNHTMIGVSIPKLRAIAKEIAHDNPYEFLNSNPLEYYEEVMLQGFVIGYMKANDDEKYGLMDKYVKVINDWSECDCVLSSLKFLSHDTNRTYNVALQYIESKGEFVRRFGIVMLMDYCLDKDLINQSLNVLLSIKSSDYYVNMAVAWALSLCFVMDYQLTYSNFVNCDLDTFTYNKTIQKCKESYRITPQQKIELSSLKRK